MCTIVYKNGALHCTGFGCLGDLKNKILYDRLMAFVNTAPSECGKETIKELREKVVVKMSKIAKSQLGLSNFPYERVKNGEFCVTGVPPCLLPLQPPSQLTTKQLQELLRTEVSVIRIPRILQQTHTPSQTDKENDTQNESNAVESAPLIENMTQQTDQHVQDLETQTDSVTQQTDQHVQDLETQTDSVTQQTDQHVQDLETDRQCDTTDRPTYTGLSNTDRQCDTTDRPTCTGLSNTDSVTQQTDQHVQDLETQTDSAVQHITDLQQNTAKHVGTTTDVQIYSQQKCQIKEM